ncbi:MAG TPA: hypothetical protein DCZ91_05480 [Lachnospiraceae bacterium]|nr:hypothetical protein [Lachnospiraceae bacterium]
MKAFICLLGILLLVILLIGKLVLLLIHRGEDEEIPVPTPEPHIPVIQLMTNVWIMEADEEGLMIFRDGQSQRYPWGMQGAAGAFGTDEGESGTAGGESGAPAAGMGGSMASGGAQAYDGTQASDSALQEMEASEFPDFSVREQVADVELTDGAVTSVEVKREKINGKILSADDAGVEVEGYGKLPLAADYKGYRLYDSLEMCTVDDLFFGYDFTDLCMEDGEICAVLMAKEEAMEYIRVLIQASDYSGRFHAAPVVTCDTDFTVVYGSCDNQKQEAHAAGEELEFGYESVYFETERVRIVPDVLTGKIIFKNCNRSQGTPSYRGQMEFLRTEDGIVAVNEVLLEEYLYSVVPSEMPAKYPFEALKAQAVCARTYAYGHMEHAGYPQYGAHVDDSTSYQVYNNILEQESTTTAVKETYGQLLRTENGSLAGTYYYSTSCGVGSDANVWKTESAPTLTYLKGKSLSRTAFAEALAAVSRTEEDGDGSEDAASQREDGDSGNRGDAPAAGGAGNGTAVTGTENGTDVADTAGTENGGSAAAVAGQMGNGGNLTADIGELLRDEEAFAAFISSVNEDDFESGEGWYRWTYQAEGLDKEHMLETLQKRYAANSKLVLTWKDGAYVSETIDSLNDITDIYIEKRGSGGVADELVIEAGAQKIKVISEHNIRYVLNDGKADVVRQDGSRVASANLLPSGFFIIETGKENGNVIGYTLTGGGFGHGVGMSQNGARAMAADGYSAGEILLYFYENCRIENIY